MDINCQEQISIFLLVSDSSNAFLKLTMQGGIENGLIKSTTYVYTCN